jgi:hypothetical protein
MFLKIVGIFLLIKYIESLVSVPEIVVEKSPLIKLAGDIICVIMITGVVLLIKKYL